MSKELIQDHEINCQFKKETKTTFAHLESKIESCDAKKTKEISELDKKLAISIESHKYMEGKLDNIDKKIDDFIKKIDEHMPSKKEVEEHAKDIKQLKSDRLKLMIWIVIALLGFIGTVAYEVVSYFITKGLGN